MDTCASCSALLHGPYCASCGEKRLRRHDLSLRHFATHALHDLTHFDTKIFRSIYLLFAKPGFLTAEFSAGRWRAYIRPTTLFILINLFFFVAKGGIVNWGARTYIDAAGASGSVLVEARAAERGLPLDAYLGRFDESARNAQRSMFFFAIPVVALLSLALFRRGYFVEHLVYSIHFHAFLLVFLTVGLRLLLLVLLVPVAWVGFGQPLEYLSREPGLSYLVIAGASLYHVFALRRAFAARVFTALIAGPLLVTAEAIFLITVYRRLLFYWVYYTV